VKEDHTGESSAIPSGGEDEEPQEEITLDANEGTAIQEEPAVRRSVRQT
jgi:hypothetical protein